MSRIQQVIETLEAERADIQKHLAWLEQQINEFHAHDGDSAAAAPARSVRRAAARRASKRRATTRSRQVDVKASIIAFLTQHPGSTAGDVAKGLNLNRGSTSTRLTQLAKAGEIKRRRAATPRSSGATSREDPSSRAIVSLGAVHACPWSSKRASSTRGWPNDGRRAPRRGLQGLSGGTEQHTRLRFVLPAGALERAARRQVDGPAPARRDLEERRRGCCYR